MVEQLGLDIVGGISLVLYPVEDTCVVELVGHKVTVGATQRLHLLVGIYHTLEQQCGGYWHVEAIVLDILFQCGQRIVWSVAADSTNEIQPCQFLGIVIV